MVHADRRDNLAIITSEPLTDDATDWCVFPLPPFPSFYVPFLSYKPVFSIFFSSVRFFCSVLLVVKSSSPLHLRHRVVVPVNHMVLVTNDLHVFITPIGDATQNDAISLCISSLTRAWALECVVVHMCVRESMYTTRGR